MNEKVGEVFAIAADNAPVPGCTVSKAVHSGANDVIYFSMAPNTDISAEIFPYHKLILVAGGSMEVYGRGGFVRRLDAGECIVTPTDTPVGMRTSESAVYTEITIRRNDTMNEAIKAGEVFELAGLVPYADGKIVNMDVAHNGKMKFYLMWANHNAGTLWDKRTSDMSTIIWLGGLEGSHSPLITAAGAVMDSSWSFKSGRPAAMRCRHATPSGVWALIQSVI